MARPKTELEEIREALATARAELRELRAALAIAFRHLNDTRNSPHYEEVGQAIQETLKRVSKWFEKALEEEEALNLSGVRKRTTLLEKREVIDKLLKECE